jgi:hypothetical protein
MTTVEYRFPLPLSLKEYYRANIYFTLRMSREQTSKGEGIEFLENSPYTDDKGPGFYTHKVVHLEKRLPGWVRAFLPASALRIEEKSWKQFPFSRTVYSTPLFGDNLLVEVKSIYKEDRGTSENALGLSEEELKKRKVELIDIAKCERDPRKYRPEEDPKTFKSKKTGRGPLTDPDWIQKTNPIVCAYKHVTVDWKYSWLMKSRIENFVHNRFFKDILTQSHLKAFCWIDEWWDMTTQDLSRYERETKEFLEKEIKNKQNAVEPQKKAQ